MNIWFWVQTWVDVDFLAVGKLTKTTFPMAYEAKKGRLTFSFYVIKKFTQIFVKVNQILCPLSVLERVGIMEGFFKESIWEFHCRDIGDCPW